MEALLAWAVLLTGYEAPEVLPIIEYKEHSYFVDRACGGTEWCSMRGLYDGQIYIDEAMKDVPAERHRALLVHEMVHYLQDLSGKWEDTCEDKVAREREAYAAQQAYLTAHGSPVTISMKLGSCK